MNVTITRDKDGYEELLVEGAVLLTGHPLDIEEVLSVLGYPVELVEVEDGYEDDYGALDELD